jgi:hypothetical protein
LAKGKKGAAKAAPPPVEKDPRVRERMLTLSEHSRRLRRVEKVQGMLQAQVAPPSQPQRRVTVMDWAEQPPLYNTNWGPKVIRDWKDFQ